MRPYLGRGDLAGAGAGVPGVGLGRDVLPPARDPGDGQHGGQAGSGPLLAGHGDDAARVQVSRDRADRFAGQHPAGGFADDGGFVFDDGHLVALVAVAAHAGAGGLALLGGLAGGAALAFALLLGLVPRGRPQGARYQPAGGGGEVDFAGGGGKLDTGLVVQVDHVFQFTRGAGEPVHMPAHDRVDPPGGDVGEQPEPFLTGLAGVGRHVVVAVHAHDVPPFALAQGAAVVLLAGHTQAGAGTVVGDPHIDRCPYRVVAVGWSGDALLCDGLSSRAIWRLTGHRSPETAQDPQLCHSACAICRQSDTEADHERSGSRGLVLLTRWNLVGRGGSGYLAAGVPEDGGERGGVVDRGTPLIVVEVRVHVCVPRPGLRDPLRP